MYEQVADDGVIFLWHFSKVSINDLISLELIYSIVGIQRLASC